LKELGAYRIGTTPKQLEQVGTSFELFGDFLGNIHGKFCKMLFKGFYWERWEH
jgi:hypothetical protein